MKLCILKTLNFSFRKVLCSNVLSPFLRLLNFGPILLCLTTRVSNISSKSSSLCHNCYSNVRAYSVTQGFIMYRWRAFFPKHGCIKYWKGNWKKGRLLKKIVYISPPVWKARHKTWENFLILGTTYTRKRNYKSKASKGQGPYGLQTILSNMKRIIDSTVHE